MLITLEGLDGSGKTTVWEALHDVYPDATFTASPPTAGMARRSTGRSRPTTPTRSRSYSC